MTTEMYVYHKGKCAEPDRLKWKEAISDEEQGFRVMWMAPFYSYSGYGSEAISFVLGIGDRLVISHFGDNPQKTIEKDFPDNVRDELREMKVFLPQKTTGHPLVSVCHSTPPSWGKSCPTPHTGAKIGRTMFETDLVPTHWVRKINRMDQVWVPTKFHVESFSRAGVFKKKLFVVPEAIDTDFFDPGCYVRHRTGIYKEFQDNFVFLSIFKWEERKGWKALVRSFLTEFTKSDKVLLYIATRKLERKQDPLKEIGLLKQEAVTDGYRYEHLPKIILHTSRMKDSSLPILYKNADAFVLPSKGEGWGRPLAEAMCMELPAIHTFWSGPTEFMTPENSYPLNVSSLSPVDDSAGPGTKGHVWAEASIPHLKQLMRRVYSEPQEAKKRGKQARRDMIEKYAIDVVAKIVHKQIMLAVDKVQNTTVVSL